MVEASGDPFRHRSGGALINDVLSVRGAMRRDFAMRSRNEWVAVLLLVVCAMPVAWTSAAAGDEVAELREQLARQQAVNEALKAQLQAVQAEVANLRKELRTTLADRDGLLREVVRQRDDLQRVLADRDQLDQAFGRHRDQLRGTLAELAQFHQRVRALEEQNRALRGMLGRIHVPDPGAVNIPPTGLEGVVLVVNDSGIVEISLGEDDGLEKGHRLDVFRKEGERLSYVARIEVVRTVPGRSACKVIPDFEHRKVQKGDVALSSLR
jgi:molybdopterin converting factor small subunit